MENNNELKKLKAEVTHYKDCYEMVVKERDYEHNRYLEELIKRSELKEENKKIIEAIKEHVKGMFYDEHILPILYPQDSSEEESEDEESEDEESEDDDVKIGFDKLDGVERKFTCVNCKGDDFDEKDGPELDVETFGGWVCERCYDYLVDGVEE